MTRLARMIPVALFLLAVCAFAQQPDSLTPARSKRIVIAASALLDGKGHVSRNTRIVIDGAKIVAIDPKAGPVDYDLRGLTVMPGWIDMHTHLTSSFGKDGKVGSEMTAEESAYRTASNAWVTLLGGFTTLQTMSQAVAFRDAIAKGLLPGPRILTIVESLAGRGEQSGTPDELRAYVRKQKEAGADIIKIYASGGLSRGAKTLSQEQLNAVCDEAKKQGLRTHVHAFRDAVPAATLAGCTQIEHGVGATDDDLKLMVEKGTYIDPQAGTLFENYILNKARYAGTPYFAKTEEGVVEDYKPAIQMSKEFLRRAAKVNGLKIVFGSDALAGLWNGPNGGASFRQFTGGGSDGHGESDRLYRARIAGRYHRARWRPVERHHRRKARCFCDEGRCCLQTRRSRRNLLTHSMMWNKIGRASC